KAFADYRFFLSVELDYPHIALSPILWPHRGRTTHRSIHSNLLGKGGDLLPTAASVEPKPPCLDFFLFPSQLLLKLPARPGTSLQLFVDRPLCSNRHFAHSPVLPAFLAS